MLGIVLPAVITAFSLLILDWLLPGVYLDTVTASVLAAISIGVVNAIIRPIIKLFSLPLTLVTFGLFSLVVNGFCFWLASALVPGFEVRGIVGFIVGPIALSFLSTTFDHYLIEGNQTSLPEA
ncbi:MAG: phage holin family protein [Cyanobacteria bacterium P01_D01_bin.36]